MYQPVNALNVYSIKNLHSALKAFSVGTCVTVQRRTALGVWVGTWGCRTGHSVWVWRTDGLVIGAAARQRGVTWVLWPPGSITWTPSCDEVRLPNPRETKVLSVKPDRTSTAAATPAQRFFSTEAGPSVHRRRPTYVILMVEGRLAFTVQLLMVSKCLPVKMSSLFLLNRSSVPYCKCSSRWLSAECRITIDVWPVKQRQHMWVLNAY